jgi:hypothetical protein
MIRMQPGAHPLRDDDARGQARALVEHTLTALLRVEATAEQEHSAAAAFLALLTPQLITALSADPAGAGAVPALTAAAEHIRAGVIDDARSELITALAALRPAPARPAVGADEVCDVCERVPPRWSIPVTGAAIDVLPGIAASASLLVCQTCRELIDETRDDEEFADLLGLAQLPRPLRGLHTRITGPPQPWPGDRQPR